MKSLSISTSSFCCNLICDTSVLTEAEQGVATAVADFTIEDMADVVTRGITNTIADNAVHRVTRVVADFVAVNMGHGIAGVVADFVAVRVGEFIAASAEEPSHGNHPFIYELQFVAAFALTLQPDRHLNGCALWDN